MAQERLTNVYALVASGPETSIENGDIDHDYDSQVHLASVTEKKRLWWRNALINAFFIASWFGFATVLSVYNKWMFAPEHFAFPSPLFVTTLHMFVQFLLATLLRLVWPQHFLPDRNPAPVDYVRKVIPTGITTALDIGLSNLSLKLITLSFYTMCKSSSLVFVLLFAFIFKLETFSFRLVGVIALIVIGVVLMVATETHFILPGFILIMSASALGGFRWSLTQLLLRSKNIGLNNPAATLFWLAPIMGVTLAITSAAMGEWGKVFASHFFDSWSETLRTCFFLVSPGVLAFCMVLSEFYILQRAGVVPMSIAGIAKEVTTITISAWFFGDELTPLNITGVSITACGIVLYTYHKYRRSMDASIPLDAHGNPLIDEETLAEGVVALQDGSSLNLEETLRLTADVNIGSGHDERAVRGPSPELDGQELLFDVGDDDEEERTAGLRAGEAFHANPELPPQYSPEAAHDTQSVWKEQANNPSHRSERTDSH
ncbi:TPT-domain-containing protein [Amylocystis lapponica]|nr:TPT-domain-containing protein [Amylocystis lapponica]